MNLSFSRNATRMGQCLLALLLAAAMPLALAAEQTPAPPSVWVPTQALAGEPVQIEGYRFQPGLSVALYRDGRRLETGPVKVDEKGQFKTRITVADSAEVGLQPIAVRADGKTLLTFNLMVSRVLPFSGADNFAIAREKLLPGLYQVAYSAAEDALFVTHSSSKPRPQTGLIKVDADTLEIVDRTTPPASPAYGDADAGPYPPPVYAVFGVAADSAAQTLWVTNSLNNTVAVYRQQDLSLLKQFDAGAVPHAHSVIVNSKLGRVYVSAYTSGKVAVFDTATLTHVTDIDLSPDGKKVSFKPLGLALSTDTGKLYVGAGPSDQIAVVDMASNQVEKVFSLGTKGKLRGLAWDADDGWLLATSFNTDQLLAIDPLAGTLEHAVYVGSRPLAVVWNQVTKLAYVSNRGADSLAVVDVADGQRVANLKGGTKPNHLAVGTDGVVFAVNKSTGPEDPQGDLLTRIAPVSKP